MSSLRHVIGIAGKARSGKDTIADCLCKKYYFNRYSFAQPIKSIVNEMFGWDSRHADGALKEAVDSYWGFSPRKAYQLFGTEFGRACNENLWIKMAEAKLPAGHWVIPDVRFDNEAEFCRKHGALIHVERPGVKAVNAHISEEGVHMHKEDYYILNNSSVAHLHLCIESIMEDMKHEGK